MKYSSVIATWLVLMVGVAREETLAAVGAASTPGRAFQNAPD